MLAALSLWIVSDVSGENLDRHDEFTCCLLVGQDTLENEMSSSQEGLLVKSFLNKDRYISMSFWLMHGNFSLLFCQIILLRTRQAFAVQKNSTWSTNHVAVRIFPLYETRPLVLVGLISNQKHFVSAGNLQWQASTSPFST